MTSATARRPRGAPGEGYWMVVFAAALLGMVGNQAARWFGVAVIGLNAITQMLFILRTRSGP